MCLWWESFLMFNAVRKQIKGIFFTIKEGKRKDILSKAFENSETNNDMSRVPPACAWGMGHGWAAAVSDGHWQISQSPGSSATSSDWRAAAFLQPGVHILLRGQVFQHTWSSQFHFTCKEKLPHSPSLCTLRWEGYDRSLKTVGHGASCLYCCSK